MSTFDAMMRDLYDPARMHSMLHGPLMEIVERDMADRHRQDLAYLGSLGDHARKVELTRRRLTRLEQRFREALDFSPCGCQDEW